MPGAGRPEGRCEAFAPNGSLWRCRHCHDLTYATRQAAPLYRLILKAQKIRERLEGNLGVLDDFPPKPKGMHWRRYQRLRQTHDQAASEPAANPASFCQSDRLRVLASTSHSAGRMLGRTSAGNPRSGYQQSRQMRFDYFGGQ
jgi:hypothetical protein